MALSGESATLLIEYGDAVIKRLAWMALAVAVIVSVVGAIEAFGFAPARPTGDAWNYLAAGERLNAGHLLYALSAGDRPVGLAPPYWSVPLLSPPPIAVAWRPLAVLGDASMILWGVAGLVASAAAFAVIAVRATLALAAVVTILAAAVAIQALSGNVNALLFPLLVVAWIVRSRPWAVGTIVAIAASIKLLPLLLILWLISAGRRRAVIATVIALAAIGGASLLGAGPSAFGDWLRAVPLSAPAPGSVATILGVSSTVILAAAAIAVIAAAAARDERWTFSIAVVAATLASPALYLGHLGLAAAALAPWLLPVDQAIARIWARDQVARSDASGEVAVGSGAVAP